SSASTGRPAPYALRAANGRTKGRLRYRRLHIRAILGLLLLALLAVPLPARAQATTGTISGVVTDESKAVLPGVTVVVSNTETGATRTLVTGERGGFRALNLQPGVYAVGAELQGFTPARRENLTLEIGRDVNADLALKIGTVSEQVTVQGAATNVELSSAVAGGVVSTTQIAELPLNGRSFMQLATLQPGVTVSRATAGVISAVTQSGTNALHGTAFEFLRDSKFDQPNYFDPIDPVTGRQVNPPFTRNQFGGTAGGPIVTNKLFYFGSYEGLRQNL